MDLLTCGDGHTIADLRQNLVIDNQNADGCADSMSIGFCQSAYDACVTDLGCCLNRYIASWRIDNDCVTCFCDCFVVIDEDIDNAFTCYLCSTGASCLC